MGADRFFVKPVVVDDVVAMVRRCLRERSGSRPLSRSTPARMSAARPARLLSCLRWFSRWGWRLRKSARLRRPRHSPRARLRRFGSQDMRRPPPTRISLRARLPRRPRTRRLRTYTLPPAALPGDAHRHRCSARPPRTADRRGGLAGRVARRGPEVVANLRPDVLPGPRRERAYRVRSNAGNVNAFAACDNDGGAPFVAATSLLEAIDAISQTKATDEEALRSGRTTSTARASSRRASTRPAAACRPLLPAGLIATAYWVSPRGGSRVRTRSSTRSSPSPSATSSRTITSVTPAARSIRIQWDRPGGRDARAALVGRHAGLQPAQRDRPTADTNGCASAPSTPGAPDPPSRTAGRKKAAPLAPRFLRLPRPRIGRQSTRLLSPHAPKPRHPHIPIVQAVAARRNASSTPRLRRIGAVRRRLPSFTSTLSVPEGDESRPTSAGRH